MKKKDLEWNVYIEQSGEIKAYNIFKHASFYEAIKKIKRNNDLFDETVKTELAYWFRNRSEYEVSVASIFGGNPQKEISVYDQVMLNFDKFMEYLRSEL